MLPEVVCPGIPGPPPCTTKSQHRLRASPPSQGSAPSAQMLTTPSGASLASCSTGAGIPCNGVALLPSCACITGASCTYDICSTSISCVDSPGTGGSWCTTIDRKELRRTVVRSPTLVTATAARDRCRSVIGRIAN
jgi:hypothetical protein